MASAMPLQPAKQTALAAEGRSFTASSFASEYLIRPSLGQKLAAYSASQLCSAFNDSLMALNRSSRRYAPSSATLAQIPVPRCGGALLSSPPPSQLTREG